MMPIAIPAQKAAIELGTGPLPGATAKESWHSQYNSVFARNVTVATLTPFLPDPGKASGTAVVVAPGGGFTTLSMQNEAGMSHARSPHGGRGVRAQDRLNQTPGDMAAYQRSLQERAAGGTPRPSAAAMMANLAPQLADARAAFALIRGHATEWHVDPARIGMVGFSAGAMLTMATTLDGQADAKPAFVGNIYGPLAAVTVPAGAPPIFVALAADDPLFGNGDFGLIQSWRAAKRPVEFHFFEQGGHGFGMYPKKITSTGWFGEFARWMTMHDWMKPAG